MVKILYVGPDYTGSNATCWRDAFVELGHEVRTIDAEAILSEPVTLAGKLARKLRRRPRWSGIRRFNDSVLAQFRTFRPDLTFYIKGSFILPSTLDETGKVGPNVAYMNDDMFNPQNQTPGFVDNVKRFHCIITTKSFNVREFERVGAPMSVYLPNAYDPKIHCPVSIPAELADLYAGDVTFIGTFRPDRADFLARLAALYGEFKLNIWGGGWHKMRRLDHLYRSFRWPKLARCVRGKELWGREMARAVRANKICLGLLNHQNRDGHTSRTFELPACGAFMLAERTEEHRMYFAEDKEAVYFSSFEEVVDKIRFYLAHESVRQKIASAGYHRCVSSGNRYVDRARCGLSAIRGLLPNFRSVTGLTRD